MFNLGGSEMLMLGVLFVLLFGPRKLPELGKALGEGLAAFREHSKAAQDQFRSQLEHENKPQPPVVEPAKVAEAPLQVEGEIVEVPLHS
jgi:sec-independent protein translocase protein TatA